MKVWHGDFGVGSGLDHLGVQDKGEVRPACLEGIHGHPAGLLPRGRSTKMFFYRLLLLDGSVYNISEISFLPGLKPFTVANSNWTQLQSDWNLVRSWAEEKGVTRFAAVGITLKACSVKRTMRFMTGTCWGSYMTLRMSSLPEVVAGVGSLQK